MNINAYIQQLNNKGINLYIKGGNLGYHAPAGLVTGELLGQLKQYKQEILEELRCASKEGMANSPKKVSGANGQDNTCQDNIYIDLHIPELAAGLRDCFQKHLDMDPGDHDDLLEMLREKDVRWTDLLDTVRKELRLNLSFMMIRKYPSINRLVDYIRRDYYRLLDRIPRLGEMDDYEVSVSQKRLWIINKLNPESIAYLIPGAYRLTGNLDITAFNRSINCLIERHEALRTVFIERNGEPRQRILPSLEFRIQVVDLEGEKHKEVSLFERIDRELCTNFSLDTAPLYKFILFRLKDREFVFLCIMHHIISDGWSLNILIQELTAYYNGFVSQSEISLASLTTTHKDFAVWHRKILSSSDVEKQLDYWKSQFPGKVPKMDFPYDFERPDIFTFHGRNLYFEINPPVSDRLKDMARNNNITMNMLILTLYGILLYKYCSREEIPVGIIELGRNHSDLGNVMGVFCNYLPCKICVFPEKSVLEHFAWVNRKFSELLDNQEVPFELLTSELERDYAINRNPLFDTMVSYHNELPGFGLDTGKFKGLAVEPCYLENTGAVLDFKLDLYDQDQGFLGVLQYNTDLLTEESVRQFISSFMLLLNVVTENTGLKVMDITLFSPEEASALEEKRKRIKNKEAGLNVVVSSTFSAEPVGEIVTAWCKSLGINVDVRFAPYNQVFQQLLDPDSLMAGNKGLNVLLVRFEDWLHYRSSGDGTDEKFLWENFFKLKNTLQVFNKTIPMFVGILPLSLQKDWTAGTVSTLKKLYYEWEKELASLNGVQMLDLRQLGTLYLIQDVFDDHKDALGHIPYSDSYMDAAATVIARSIAAWSKHNYKVIVLDCDNTLWSGQIGENGIEGISVSPYFQNLQEFMLGQNNKGMLLALCSKNNENEVWDVFDNHPGMILKREHIVEARINWNPKSENLKELARQLNLGLDSFIFIDDSQTECLEVAENCPQVLVLPLPGDQELFAPFLKLMWAFDKLHVTREDKERTVMYKADQRRNSLSHQKSSLKEFLIDLGLKVSMREPAVSDCERISQLTQRTNQFNLNGKRRDTADILSCLQNPDYKLWIVEGEDRFGSYGIIGAVIGKKYQTGSFLVENLLISCRALGREIEIIVMAGIKKYCYENSLESLLVGYRQTERNIPIQKFIAESGFFEALNEKTGEKALPVLLNTIPENVSHIHFYYEEKYPGTAKPVQTVETMNLVPVNVFSGDVKEKASGNPFDLDTIRLIRERIKDGRYLLTYEYFPGNSIRKILKVRTGSKFIRYEAPVGDTERKLADIWSELLSLDNVGRLDHFFGLGANSLLATSLVSRINKSFNRNIGLNDVFDYPVLRDLAIFISGECRKEYQLIPAIEEAEYYPLSQAQFRIFFIAQLSPQSISYNNTGFYRLKGNIDISRLHLAINTLMERHETLRTSFVMVNGEPYQKVHHGLTYELPVVPAENKTLDQLAESFIRPFRLSEAPLFRIELAKLEEDEFFVMFDIHHIISDGWSLKILIYEMIDLFIGKTLKPLSIQYKDFAKWQKSLLESETYAGKKSFWLKYFQGELPMLNLPLDYKRPVVMTGQGDHLTVFIQPIIKERIDRLVREKDVTLFMVLVCAYAALLSRYCGQEDVVVGTPISGRVHHDIDPLIGMFVNTLALRLKPESHMSFWEFVRESKKSLVDVYKNQDYPFEVLVDHLNIQRDISRNPLFDTMFTLQTTDYSSFASNGLELLQHKYYKKDSQFDLSVDAIEIKRSIELVFEYSTELFKAETINRLAGHYVNFLTDAVLHPDKRLSDITFMEEQEKQLLLSGFNSKIMVTDQPRVFHKAFENQVEQRPEQAALFFEGQYMSYRELNEKANMFAWFLKEKGVSRGDRVGIFLDRSFELYVAIFAVMKIGGAFIPIAVKTPKERVVYYLQDSQARFVITSDENSAFLDFNKSHVILVDTQSLDGNSINNPDYEISPDDLMYQIYTSGTTGQPKGVMVTHGQLTGLGYAWQKEYRLTEFPVSLLQIANISFDVFVGDLARTFLNGGKLVICPEEVRLNLQELYRLLQNEKVNIFESTPQLVIPLMDYIHDRGLTLDFLKVLLIGSDIFKIEDYRRLLKTYGQQMRIINSYGVTEATIDSTYFESTLENLEDTLSGNVPIGKPFPNVRCIVVDSSMNLQPTGVPGELLIGGVGVSNGYWKREALNKERFIYSDILGGKCYRTGDVAIWNNAGYLEFVGRSDRQVKIRGYRVELSEIENVLVAHSEIKEAIVTYVKNNSGGYLYGYIVEKKPVDSVRLIAYLSEKLPEYMVPVEFMRLETLPLTSNGKIDFKGLPHPVINKIPVRKVTAPRSPLEKELFQIWKAVLETEEISIHDNFFDVGGNSALILKLFNQIQNQITMDLSVPELFSYPTISLLAKYIEDSSSAPQENGKRTEIEDLLDRIENESINLELAKKILMEM